MFTYTDDQKMSAHVINQTIIDSKQNAFKWGVGSSIASLFIFSKKFGRVMVAPSLLVGGVFFTVATWKERSIFNASARTLNIEVNNSINTAMNN